jgi:hypothetical protein
MKTFKALVPNSDLFLKMQQKAFHFPKIKYQMQKQNGGLKCLLLCPIDFLNNILQNQVFVAC